jgi:DNA-binding MarR family transcriptional regulator
LSYESLFCPQAFLLHGDVCFPASLRLRPQSRSALPVPAKLASILANCPESLQNGKGTIMELRHLRYFVAVADALSFTQAAARLHLAQPSLTRQIKDLEAEIGVQLFDRSGKRIALTPEGEAFLLEVLVQL